MQLTEVRRTVRKEDPLWERKRGGAFSRALLLLLLSLLLAPGSGCDQQVDWVQYRGNNGSGATPNSLYPPLGLKWKLKLQTTEQQAKSFNPPMVMGSDIYFGSADGNFYSLDMDSGYMNWIFKARAPVNSVPFVDEERVYFGSNDGKVYAVDRKEGKERWHFQTDHTVQSLVLRYKDRVIFTSDTGDTFFLDTEGREVNRIPNPVWSHHTFQVYDDVVYWAPRGRNFGAYDIKERRFLWIVNVNVPFAVWYSFPALDEENVSFASNFFRQGFSRLTYYALDRITGETVWQFEDEMEMGQFVAPDQNTLFLDHVDKLDYMAPALWGDLVIFTSGDRVVRAFHRKTGRLVWRKKLDYPTSSAPTVAGDRIYLGTRGGRGYFQYAPPQLICLSAETGDYLWDTDLEGAVMSAPVIAGKRILFGTDRHQFYVLEEVF